MFGNRLFDPLVPTRERQRALDRFVGAADEAVFLLPDFDMSPTDRGLGHHGFVLEVLGEGTAGSIDLTRDERGERYSSSCWTGGRSTAGSGRAAAACCRGTGTTWGSSSGRARRCCSSRPTGVGDGEQPCREG